MTHRISLSLGLLAAVLCGLLVGCESLKQDKGKEGDEAAEAEAAEGEKSAEASKLPADCQKYADQLCEGLGADSSACSGVKDTLGLMAPEACSAGLDNIDYSKKMIAERGKSCDELMDKLCKDLGEDTQTCSMVREQTPKFDANRCDQLLSQYDKVLADLKRREDANKPLSEEKQKTLAQGGMAFGPEDAKVTVIEFSDFQCPYCSKAADTVSKIKEKYGDKVRFVFRQFPLSFHKQAHLAAQAALAAGAQDKFWEYHDLLFENQKELKREHLEQYAAELNLDMAKFKKALDDKTYAAQVDKDMELGKELPVTGTPTMYINGVKVMNPTDAEMVSSMIDKELGES